MVPHDDANPSGQPTLLQTCLHDAVQEPSPRQKFSSRGRVEPIPRQQHLHPCGVKARSGRRESGEKPIDRLRPHFFESQFAICGVYGTSVLRPGSRAMMLILCKANLQIAMSVIAPGYRARQHE